MGRDEVLGRDSALIKVVDDLKTSHFDHIIARCVYCVSSEMINVRHLVVISLCNKMRY